eukprot:328625-Chlamydomonas_euryale.AAC.1
MQQPAARSSQPSGGPFHTRARCGVADVLLHTPEFGGRPPRTDSRTCCSYFAASSRFSATLVS